MKIVAIDFTYFCNQNLLYKIGKIHHKNFRGLVNIECRAKFIHAHKMETKPFQDAPANKIIFDNQFVEAQKPHNFSNRPK